MQVPYLIIIPARYASTRLPGKPLLEIKNKTLLQHVFDKASATQANSIYIATDDERIAKAAEAFGANVLMTSTSHQSGTDRLAEAVSQLNLSNDEIIVNLQGDEYGLPVELIDQVAMGLHNHPDKQVSTLCEVITDIEDYKNPNVVKVVFNKDNTAIYFSRAPIPANRSGNMPKQVFRHIGLYAYRADYLRKFTQLSPCDLEQSEALEQLRVLYYGGKIHIDIAVAETGIGIDTKEDLERARSTP